MTVKPIRFNDRLHFVLLEINDGDVYPHGIVIAPAEMNEAEAIHCIERMERWAIGFHGDVWTWDHVIDALKRKNFGYIRSGYFVEQT